MQELLHRAARADAAEILRAFLVADEESVVLVGRPDTGRSTVLRLVAEGLAAEGYAPIVVSPPVRQIDTASVALVETVVGLAEAGLLPIDGVPWQVSGRWEDRIDDVRAWFKAAAGGRVVLLLDDVRDWPIPEANDGVAHIGEVIDLLLHEVRGRKIVVGDRRTGAVNVDLEPVPGQALLSDRDAWGPIADVVRALSVELPDLAVRDPSHIALVVAYAALASPTAVAEWWSQESPTEAVASRLVDLISDTPRLRALWHAVLATALVRRPIPRAWIEADLDRLVDPLQRAVFERCFMIDDTSAMIVREIRNAVWRTRRTDFVDRSRRLAGERFRDLYADRVFDASGANRPETLLHGAELLHIGSLLGDLSVTVYAAPAFADQLSAIGVAHLERWEWAPAAEAFDRALEVDPEDAFARHYLGFSLDNDALEPRRVEAAYARALTSEWWHAAWHARFLSFLVVQARISDVRRCWVVSRSMLGTPDGQGSLDLYRLLHTPVAANLLRRSELPMTYEVLDDIPEWVRSDLPGYEDQRQRLSILEAAQELGSFVPARRAATDWSSNPELLSERLPDGRPLQRWMAAGVERAHEDGFDLAVAIVEAPGHFHTGTMTLSFEQLDRYCVDVARAQQLDEGDFVELGVYGLGSELSNDPLIRVLKREDWYGGIETPLDPSRYLRRSAWLTNSST